MSTKRRIQAGILLVVFVVLAVAGFVVQRTVRTELVGRIDAELVGARDAILNLIDPLDETGLRLLERIADQPDRESAIVVFDAGGTARLTVASGTATDPDPLPDLGRIGVDELRARTNPFGVDAVDGRLEYRAVSVTIDDALVVIATPTDGVVAVTRRVGIVLLIAAGGAVVFIALATSMITRIAIRPVDEMIDAAEIIGGGDLEHRIDTSSQDGDVRRLSNALNEMLRRLEEAFAARQRSEQRLRRFVADASHELRSPLASIRGYAELLASGAADDPDDAAKAVDRIRSEAVRTGDLVEDLLLLARLDQGRTLAAEPVDLNRVVTDCVADARAVEPDRTIDVTLPDDVVTVTGDDARLHQVLGNLLANTRDHAPGSPVHVVLHAGTGETVELTVADGGPGMDREARERVFDRFWRADASRNRRSGGSGLGLAITAALVEAHGGAISVDAEPGRGATFRVVLPRPEARTETSVTNA